jgi:hypothetical protein
MFIFGVGALVMAAWLAWLVLDEFLDTRKDTMRFGEKLSFATLAAGILCIVVIAVKSFF